MSCVCRPVSLLPSPGDTEESLLAKIAFLISEGGSGGVSSISINGGPAQTGAVSINTSSGLLNFTDENSNADGVGWSTAGTVEIFRSVGASGFLQLSTARVHRNVDDSEIAILGGIGKSTSAFYEVFGQAHATSPGHIVLTTKGQTAGSGTFHIRNAPNSSVVSVLRAAMTWEGDWQFTPTWNDIATTFTAIDLNVTNTASADGSLLLNLMVGGVNKWTAAKRGSTVQFGGLDVTPNSGPGTVAVSAGLPTVTGTNTLFRSTFVLGDKIVANAETRTISAIASDTSMTTDNWTATASGLSYTTLPGRVFRVLDSGIALLGTAADVTVTSAQTALLRISEARTNGGSIIGVSTLVQSSFTVAPVASTSFGGVFSAFIQATNTQNITGASGLVGTAYATNALGASSGTCDNQVALRVQVSNSSTGGFVFTTSTALQAQVPAGTGAMTSLIGFALPAWARGTNNTGILLGTVTAVTGNYAIHSILTYDSYFAGNIGIAILAPPQKLSVLGAGGFYNAFTSSTNFERLDLQWTTNVAQIWTEKGSGGGTARDLVLGADATELIHFQTGSKLSFFAATPVVKQTSGENLTNNVTAGGTDGTIANYTDLVIYANDAAAIRNDIYQLARKLKQVNDALRTYGLLT